VKSGQTALAIKSLRDMVLQRVRAEIVSGDVNGDVVYTVLVQTAVKRASMALEVAAIIIPALHSKLQAQLSL
jgi:hypothetical protein